MKHFGLSEEELKTPVRGDLTRAAIAARIFRETTVSQQWIADQLGMKSAPNVCQQIRRFRNLEDKMPKKLQQWDKIFGSSLNRVENEPKWFPEDMRGQRLQRGSPW